MNENLPQNVVNVDLENLMQEMATRPNDAAREKLFEEFSRSRVIVLGNLEDVPALSADGAKQKEVVLTVWNPKEGECLTYLYTSSEAFERGRGNVQKWIILQGKQFFSVAAKSPITSIAVNPGGPVSGEITRHEIQMIAEGTAFKIEEPHKIGHTFINDTPFVFTPFTVGEKENKIISMSKEVFKTYPSVLKVYFALVTLGAGLPHFCMGVSFADGTSKNQISEILMEMHPRFHHLLDTTESLDFIPLDLGEVIGKEIVKNGLMVYVKGQ